tara:strand:- start:21634 stop:22416 length:783 start_codon:yes stop_codon:yes gene_type:complete
MNRNKSFITPVRDQETNTFINEFVSVILLCEKAGRRMKSYGPTPLIEVGGRKLIDIQISAIKTLFKHFEIIVACGFESDKVVKYVRSKHSNINIRVVENQVYHHSNCCESLRLCINNTVNDCLLVMSGDLLFSPESIGCAASGKSCVVSQSNRDDSNLEVGVITDSEDVSINFHYGIKNSIWSEILFLKGKELIDDLRRTVSSVEFKNRLMFEALNSMIDSKCKLKVVENPGPEIVKINNIKTLRKVNRLHEGYFRKLLQ